MKKLLLVVFIIVFTFTVFIGSIQAKEEANEILKNYKSVKIIDDLQLKVPTVVEVPFDQETIKRESFAVLELETNEFLPHYFYNNRNKKRLRFLAQPDKDYEVYFNTSRSVDVDTPESGNLRKDEGVKALEQIETKINPAYQKPDIDGDGIIDQKDNCVRVKNPKQTDRNDNGRGDACEDFDRDGVINKNDNCKNQPNSDQKDTDGDDIGDVCDDKESRITERLPWLPWLGLGLVGGVVLILLVVTVRKEN